MSRRAIAVVSIGAGALFVVLGSLFPLYGTEIYTRFVPPGGQPSGARGTIALTAWELIRDPVPPADVRGDGDSFPTYGHSLVVAAVLAAIGAGLQLRSPLLAAIGRFGVLVGFGLVVGTLWTALETLRQLLGDGGSVNGGSEQFVGTGTWMIGGAVLVMLVGVVLAQDWPARLPRPTGVSVYQVDDDDTPPFGIAIPVSELEVPATDPSTPVPPVPPAAEPELSGDDRHPTGGNPSTVEP
ncbi:hypothetical protein ALI22I_16215 [Saccharothrix sp. ALI-22-I]|uniref:hypothetical protein n=1 Tax=Saccharothrix sp. ALI-22-I TaxID=1933778 RepID=UPI00097BDF1E|nr:hypothetical protein [Saccharothrix sp. ALI-22-I]ONI89067.1 hypothetical protein ALI22I_16215 [Saccharothrix sp. ALI-22-I]